MNLENGKLDKELAALAGLFEKDPELFEKRSRKLLEDFIADVPEAERARVWGVQLRIDAELRPYRDPVARMNKMVELFWSQVHCFLETLEHPEQVLERRRTGREPGKVIPFRRRDELH